MFIYLQIKSMHKFWLIILIIAFFISCETKRDSILKRIPVEQYEKFMALSHKEFDQTQGVGWRQFNDDPELQIHLISDYMAKNNTKKQILVWHLGQVYGMNDDHQNAIKQFEQCIYNDTTDNPYKKAWDYYAQGTIAFMDRDEAKLDLYIDSLQNYVETMNIEVLLRLKENFSEAYKNAY